MFGVNIKPINKKFRFNILKNNKNAKNQIFFRDLKSNLLTHVPNLKHCKNLGVL